MYPNSPAIPEKLLLGKGDALLIVPPFAMTNEPFFGVHMLQSCARRLRYMVNILYANLLLAAFIGNENYDAINSEFQEADLNGERFFARASYGLPPFGADGFIDSERAESWASRCRETYPEFNIPEIKALESKADQWVDAVANLIAAHDFKVVGCSTSFEQTSSSIALLNRVKQLRPDIVTIIGGPNCGSVMARGILSLSDSVDYVFSGECDTAFPDFLAKVREGRLPREKIVRGGSCITIEDLPLPDYAEFFHQHRLILPWISEDEFGAISYESSRGCWWGEKRKCTFCGLNGEIVDYRSKSAGKVLDDLKKLREMHPSRIIIMVDNALPSEYFKSLIPRLERELPNSNLSYQVRPNLVLKDFAALKRAGINIIQPGIESLSTPSLELMRKGVTSRRNIALLRYGISVGIDVAWNLMIDIPGEQLEELEGQLSLIPLLHHLQPPHFGRIIIQRFSSYFTNPGEYGLSNIRPWDSYFASFPKGADVDDIANYFKADYRSASRDHPEVKKSIEKEIEIWRNLWRPDCIPPKLAVISKGDGKFLLLDTRGLPGTEPISVISRDEAKVALSDVGLNRGDRLLEWAIERKLVAELDSAFAPLATGSPDTILEFEEEEMRT